MHCITLQRKIKDDLNELRYRHCSWIGRLDIIKISVLPQIDLCIQYNPNQNHSTFFEKIGMLILEFYGKAKNLE